MFYVVDAMALGKNRLLQFRERRGITQEALARKVGVTRQTIISIEGGRYSPSIELSLKLARAFGCRVEDLFGL
jgi:putative transcriptional regulator